MHQPKPLTDVDIGFLKEASANGYDINFLTGYIDEFNDYQQKWAMIVDVAEQQHGPSIRVKLGQELAKLSHERGGCSIDDPKVQMIFNYLHKQSMVKAAADPVAAASQNEHQLASEANTTPLIPGTELTGNEAVDAQRPNTPTPWTNPDGMNWGHAAGGGGIGGLLGLLLGHYLFKSPMLGALLGGLGGAGVGGMYGNKIIDMIKGLFHNNQQPSPVDHTEQPGQGTGENDPLPKPSGVSAPAASQNEHQLATPAATTPQQPAAPTPTAKAMPVPPDIAELEKQVLARAHQPTPQPAPAPSQPPVAAGQAINPIAAPAQQQQPPVHNPFRGANGQVDPAAAKHTMAGMSTQDFLAASQRSRMNDVGGRTDMQVDPHHSFAPGQIFGAQAAGKPIMPPVQPPQAGAMLKKSQALDYWLSKQAYTSSSGNPLMPQQPAPQPQQQQQQQNPRHSPLLPPGAPVGRNPASQVIMPSGYTMDTLGVNNGRTVGQQMPQPKPTNTTPQLNFNKQQHPLAI
ncbi:MAG: hypothetical protein EBU46_00825 [Nitrosomonadaceae bacterium]|nr:hypothetical protein [Nitrosomonadaceae bacterium]